MTINTVTESERAKGERMPDTTVMPINLNYTQFPSAPSVDSPSSESYSYEPQSEKELYNETEDLIKTYVQPPAPTELDDIRSFHVLGLDFKKTPEQQMQLAEVNGLWSGTDGITETNVSAKDLMQYGLVGMDVWNEYNYESVEQDANIISNGLHTHLEQYGLDKMTYINSLLADRREEFGKTVNPTLFKDAGIPDHEWLSKIAHHEWHSYDEIADTMADIELTLSDKATVDQYFEGFREVKPLSYSYTQEDVARLLANEDAEYVIFKPRNGLAGKEVSVQHRDEVNLNFAEDSDYIVEPFIESDAIFSEETGHYHDGCMRYLVLLEERTDGTIETRHFGGYWRLSPEPIQEYGDEEAMIASLCDKYQEPAIPEKASPIDLLRARNTVDAALPTIYQDMLTDIRGEDASAMESDGESEEEVPSNQDEQEVAIPI